MKMPELIDKSAVIDSVYSATERIIIAVEEESPEIADILVNARDAILKKIERQPTIEPEARRGEWIIKRDEFYTDYEMYYAECSECKHTESAGMADRLKFCPICGAKMNKGE